jgi:ribA/ribD-fused uncharacterized protein
MAIKFYSVNNPYGEFSNFAPYPIQIDGKLYPTSEHYFQAEKFLDESYREGIRDAASPREAARLGRSREFPIRGDWESVKVDVMRRAVRTKFSSHAQLLELLLSTGNEQIIEAAAGDFFWGAGVDGSGSNWLGRILMEVREELRGPH